MEDANNIKIANIDIPVADKEVDWALPQGCRWFTMQSRDGTAIRVAVNAGLVANSQPPYFTIKLDNQWDEKQLGVDIRHGFPLYFACSSAGKVVEVIMGIYDPSVGGKE